MTIKVIGQGTGGKEIRTGQSRREQLVWEGGAIVAQLKSLEGKLRILRREYDEAGPEVVHRKCMC